MADPSEIGRDGHLQYVPMLFMKSFMISGLLQLCVFILYESHYHTMRLTSTFPGMQTNFLQKSF